MRYLIFLPTLLLVVACGEKKPAEINQEQAAVIDSPNNFGRDSADRQNEELRRRAGLTTN